MRGAGAVAAIGLALAGCASEAPSPSYLGAGDASASEESPQPQSSAGDALRAVPSNKILGAMAFQKVTGRAVDPSRLSGGAR